MIKINLLAEGKRPAAVRRMARPTSFLESPNIALWALVAAVLLIGALPAAAWWWLKSDEVADNVAAIKVAQDEVDELAAIIREVEQFKREQAELEHKIAVINELRNNQTGPVRVMDNVSRSLPELLWLDRLQMQGTAITISGRAFNSNAVASFMDNLDRVPEFQEPTLRDLAQGGGGVYSFTVTFNFSHTPPPAAATEAAPGEEAVPDDAAPAGEAAGGLAAMAMQTGLEGKPWWYGLTVGAVLAAVILGLVWWQVIDPLNEQIVQQEAQLAELQKKISEGRAAKAQLPQFRERVRDLELELDKLLRILPSRRNTPELLRRVRSLAEQGDFGFRRFTPGAFIEREFFSEWPIRIDLTGGYHNLATFFDKVSRLSRIINIENLQIQAASGEHTISATFTAKTFIYKEPEPDETAAATTATGG